MTVFIAGQQNLKIQFHRGTVIDEGIAQVLAALLKKRPLMKMLQKLKLKGVTERAGTEIQSPILGTVPVLPILS